MAIRAPSGFPRKNAPGRCPRALALRQLVMGEALDRNSAAQYGFALELLCRHLGEEILPDAWGGGSWGALEATGLDDVLMGSGAPSRFPVCPASP